jgi:hypothetical protein
VGNYLHLDRFTGEDVFQFQEPKSSGVERVHVNGGVVAVHWLGGESVLGERGDNCILGENKIEMLECIALFYESRHIFVGSP